VDGETISAAPEYDVCNRLALQHKVPLMVVFNAAFQAGLAHLREIR
jgi:uncharacterized protein (DUF111 family)